MSSQYALKSYRFLVPTALVIVLMIASHWGTGLSANLRNSFSTEDPWADVRLGANFIPYFSSGDTAENRITGPTLDTTTTSVQPDTIESLLADAGVLAVRQILSADLLWSTVEPQNNEWNFDAADAVLMRSDSPVEHMVTLFSMQFAWPTPPWVTDESDITLTCEIDCEDYIKTVVQRYAAVVDYWEIGNEMDKWSVAGADAKPLDADISFTPEQIADFVEDVSALIHRYDSNAVVIAPSISSNDPAVDWLDAFASNLSAKSVDAFGYHSYYSWQRASAHRQAIQSALDQYGFKKKAVILTEAGSSSNADATTYTNYPNSLETQASDVFRVFVQALAAGDRQIIYHAYQDAPEGQGGEFIDFGLLTTTGELKPVYYALQLFSQELLPLKSVVAETADSKKNVYKITLQDGSLRYVVWGEATWSIPKNIHSWTSVYSTDGAFEYTEADYGESIPMSLTPILAK